jgi:hypothetical protein
MLVKTIARLTYWVGMTCVVLALISRGMNALGFEMTGVLTKGHPIDYHSLLDGALLFLFSSPGTVRQRRKQFRLPPSSDGHHVIPKRGEASAFYAATVTLDREVRR